MSVPHPVHYSVKYGYYSNMDIDNHGQTISLSVLGSILKETQSQSHCTTLYYIWLKKYECMLFPLEIIAYLLSAEGDAIIGEGGRLKMAIKNAIFMKP